ncbi:hypothetical protein GC197_12895 [bacterium]|nr:hypothetical protein [bacterium]
MKPTTRQSNPTPPRSEHAQHGTPERRIDDAHVVSIDPPAPEVLGDDQGIDLAVADLDSLPDWQRRQINQLARLMRDRQMELDRREAELNARTANFESQQRSAALAMAEDFAPPERPARQPSPAAASSPLRSIEETIRAWRRKWRGQKTDIREVEPEPTDSVTVRLEKLTEVESQLAQQWALLKNSQALQALREKEFASYTQKVEQELEQNRIQQNQLLEHQQQQLARHQEDLTRREDELADVQQELEHAFADLRGIRDQLELAWAEIRVRIPSALRRRLDHQTEYAIDQFDEKSRARHQSARSEIRDLLRQLELAKLEIQEEQVQLEDQTQRQDLEVRRAKRELADREAQVRAQLAQLRREHESLNESRLEMLRQRYQELTQQVTPKAA